jgi:chromosome segregation ATPase
MAEIDDLQNLIRINKKRLAILEEQRAVFGYSTPPHVIMEIQDIQDELERLYTRLAELEDGAQVTADAAGGPEGASASKPANALTPSHRHHLEQEHNELQRSYDALTKAIAALDIDISRAVDEFRKQPLQEQRKERAAEREQVTNRMAAIEAKLAGAA